MMTQDALAQTPPRVMWEASSCMALLVVVLYKVYCSRVPRQTVQAAQHITAHSALGTVHYTHCMLCGLLTMANICIVLDFHHMLPTVTSIP